MTTREIALPIGVLIPTLNRHFLPPERETITVDCVDAERAL